MLQDPKADHDYRPRMAVLNAQRKAKEGACIASTGSGKSGRRPPHKTTDAQKRVLLAEFENNPSPQAKERERIARILNVERRIVKNWFSNQRAFRRKTGQGYPGCSFGPESSVSGSPSHSDDEWDGEKCRKEKDAGRTNVPRQDDTDVEMDGTVEIKLSPAPVYPVLRTTTNASSTLKIPTRRHYEPPKKAVLALTPDRLHPAPGTQLLPPISEILAVAPSPPTIIPAFPLRSTHPSVAIPRSYYEFQAGKIGIRHGLGEIPLPPNRYPESALRSTAGMVSVS